MYGGDFMPNFGKPIKAVFYFKERIGFLQGLSFSLIGISVIIFNIPNFKSQLSKRNATHVKI